MTQENVQTVIIAGAGPAGLTAACSLLRHKGYRVIILEESFQTGGISRTEKYKGNRMDIGGHRFFTKVDSVNDFWQSLMPMQGKPAYDDLRLDRIPAMAPDGPDPEQVDRVMLSRNRVSRIYYLKRFFDYPVTLSLSTVFAMGLGRTFLAGTSFLWSMIHKRREDSLEDFYINRFGRRLYSMFFERYTEKLWGVHPGRISPSWGAQRVKGLSLGKAVMNVLTKPFRGKNAAVETSLIETFQYPKFGPGQLWETAAERVIASGGEIRYGQKVVRVEMDKTQRIRRVYACSPDGVETAYDCDAFFSSMPVKDLMESFSPAVPDDVLSIAQGLPYRDFITVGVLVKKLAIANKTDRKTLGNIVPDCWIYIQEPDVRLGRLQIFNNWSPYMVEDPEHTVWLGLEYFCTEGDDLWEQDEASFKAFAISELEKIGIIEEKDVLDSVEIRVKKAYPAYFGTYERFDELRAWLDQVPNLYCIGRNGQHRYNNMDHSMLTAMEAVDVFRSGDRDRSRIWDVNTEKSYHETRS